MASIEEGGSLQELCSLKLWRQRSMFLMMGGNLALSVYYVIMGLVTSPEAPASMRLTNAEFMACSNLASVATFSCGIVASRPLRRQCAAAYGCRGGGGVTMPRVDPMATLLACTAESFNYLAMFAISYSFNLNSNAGELASCSYSHSATFV